MFLPDETLLCLHAADGRSGVVYTIHKQDFDSSVGSTGDMQGRHFRVIRGAEVEPFPDGNSYWAIHALEIGHVYH